MGRVTEGAIIRSTSVCHGHWDVQQRFGEDTLRQMSLEERAALSRSLAALNAELLC
jgi:hypothetical protein